MNAFILSLIIGLTAAVAPLLSLAVWSGGLYLVSPHVRRRARFWRDRSSHGANFRNIIASLIVPAFVISALVSGGLAIVISVVILIPPMIVEVMLGTSGTVSFMIGLISAGPVEESTKLLVSIILFLLIYWLHPKVRPGSKQIGLKDGIMVGLFVGASFGAFESVLYISGGMLPLVTEPFVYENADPIIFRILFGVSLHAVWTGISSSALGDRRHRVLKTLSFLLLASFIHSFFNGIQGAIMLVAGLDGLLWLMVINGFQISLIAVSILVLWKLWNR
ncbi:MAG: PrsW family intramembrane metalloprotease [Thermoplasmata archaeon]|nr:PrsW family intramembrane metalloprotease [Thermoplasmata archaeon]